MRIPFSSLRYQNTDPQTWGILLYRNRPRDFRYQIFSARLPRGGNCFIYRSNALVGLERLPSGGHLVAAPYLSATSSSRPVEGPGSALVGGSVDPEVGFDLGDRSVRVHRSRRDVVSRSRPGPIRRLLRVRAVRVQAQLAVGAVCRIRRRSRAVGSRAARAIGPAMGPSHLAESRRRRSPPRTQRW